MRQRRRQAARDVVRHVHAADRDGIREDQITAEKYPDRRRAAAHIDNRDAEIPFILDETGQTRGVRADDQRLGFEMSAPDRRGVVAHRGDRGGHDVHVDAEPLAGHAAWIDDAAAVVDREADRDRVDDLAIRRIPHRIAAFEHLAHVGVADLAPADGNLGLDDARGAIAARQVDDGAVDLLAGNLLGRLHRAAYRGAGGFEIDDRAAAHAAGDLLADAEDARFVFDACDDAADLCRADVDCRDDA